MIRKCMYFRFIKCNNIYKKYLLLFGRICAIKSNCSDIKNMGFVFIRRVFPVNASISRMKYPCFVSGYYKSCFKFFNLSRYVIKSKLMDLELPGFYTFF